MNEIVVKVRITFCQKKSTIKFCKNLTVQKQKDKSKSREKYFLDKVTDIFNF